MNFLQSKYWKESKKNLGNKVFDVGDYFFHTTPLPLMGKNIGYMPRPDLQNINWQELFQKAKEANCIYVTIDADNAKPVASSQITDFSNKQPNFNLPTDKYTFEKGTPVHLQENTILDLTKTDEELLDSMKQKHRYNLNLAKKKGVTVKISDSEDAFAEFLKLYQDTVVRQQYHGRSQEYIKTVWNTLKTFETQESINLETIATAYYVGKPLASWFLFLFEDTIYYPYGGSSDEDKNVMAPYELVWEIIQWGKQNGYKKLDLWGIKSISRKTIVDSAGISKEEVEYDGFSRFKVGFGGEIVEYSDTVDFVIDKNMYSLVKTLANLRSKILFK